MTTPELQSDYEELGSADDVHLRDIIFENAPQVAKMPSQTQLKDKITANYGPTFNRLSSWFEGVSQRRKVAAAAGALALIAGAGVETGRRAAAHRV